MIDEVCRIHPDVALDVDGDCVLCIWETEVAAGLGITPDELRNRYEA